MINEILALAIAIIMAAQAPDVPVERKKEAVIFAQNAISTALAYQEASKVAAGALSSPEVIPKVSKPVLRGCTGPLFYKIITTNGTQKSTPIYGDDCQPEVGSWQCVRFAPVPGIVKAPTACELIRQI